MVSLLNTTYAASGLSLDLMLIVLVLMQFTRLGKEDREGMREKEEEKEERGRERKRERLRD